MNLSASLIVIVLWAASVAAAGWRGYLEGEDATIARLVREDDIEQRAAATAAAAAASAIQAIKVQQVTIRQETEREIQTNTVYRDCRATAGVMRDLNASLTGATEPAAASGVVPSAAAAR